MSLAKTIEFATRFLTLYLCTDEIPLSVFTTIILTCLFNSLQLIFCQHFEARLTKYCGARLCLCKQAREPLLQCLPHTAATSENVTYILGYSSFSCRIRDFVQYREKSSGWITEETQFSSRHEKECFFSLLFPNLSYRLLDHPAI